MNRTRSIRRCAAVLLFAAWWSQFAPAAQRIDEQRDMHATGSLRLSVVSADVEVRGWDQNRFHLTGALGHEDDELTISGDADAWRIKVDPADNGGLFGQRRRERSRLQLMLPHAAVASLTSVSSDFEISGLDGETLKVTTVSGDIMADVAVPELVLKSVSGDTRIVGDQSALEMSTVSGDSEMTGLAGHIKVESVSGDVELQAENVSDLTAQTVSGTFRLALTLARNARLKLNAHSGDIRLDLPADSRFVLDSNSFSGEVYNEFPAVDNAGARIEASSFSGDIRIQKTRD